ncbi:MAG: acyl-CoA dehydrogenase family protein [Myxococcota bacterium]|nr:acyl-CoA dehydrogenase family protein [Myxococcota bacterium]
MSAEPISPLSPVTLAREMAPLIAQRADEAEEARRMPAELSQKLAQKGFFSMWVPTELGGGGVPLASSLESIEILSQADPSVGWVVGIGISSTLVLPHFDPEISRSLFAHPETIICGVYAPKGRAEADGEHHFRVSGQWPFGSGTQNADWVLSGSHFFRDGEIIKDSHGMPRTHMVVVPASEVEFLDTWHTSGMRGTGSTDYRLNDVRISEDHIAAWKPHAMPDNPLYRIPQLTLLATAFGSIALGLARGALEELGELANGKVATGQSQRMSERRDVQGEVARAEVKLRAARGHYYECVEAIWEAAREDRVGLDERSALRLSMLHAVEIGAEVALSAYHLGGATAIYEKSRLQRFFRDSHVITQHVQVRPDLYSVIGSHLLGCPKATGVL